VWRSRRATSSPPRCPTRRRSYVTGTGRDGEPRAVYLHHVVDNEWSMREYGHQAVVWQTAVNPVVALELLADGTWKGAGVLGPEAFPSQPFLDLLAEHGAPHGVEEREPRRRRPGEEREPRRRRPGEEREPRRGRPGAPRG
jgi:saccharopine dehydrogenase-like NADP-dependent oxidoreductase